MSTHGPNHDPAHEPNLTDAPITFTGDAPLPADLAPLARRLDASAHRLRTEPAPGFEDRLTAAVLRAARAPAPATLRLAGARTTIVARLARSPLAAVAAALILTLSAVALWPILRTTTPSPSAPALAASDTADLADWIAATDAMSDVFDTDLEAIAVEAASFQTDLESLDQAAWDDNPWLADEESM